MKTKMLFAVTGALLVLPMMSARADIASKAYADTKAALQGAGAVEVATVNATGQYIRSGTALADLATDAEVQTIVETINSTNETALAGKADKVDSATNGNLAGLDATGNLTDSGVAASDVASATATAEALEDINEAIDTKQDKSAAAYNLGNATGTWTAMTQAQQDALNSGVTTTVVTQVSTNTTAIENLSTQTAANKQDKSTAAYSLGNATGTWTAMTDEQVAAINSGATTTNIAQIATNTTNITQNATDIDALETTVGNLGDLAALDEVSVNELDTALAARIPLAPSACSDTTNFCVLTSNGSAYLWEVIAR